MNHTILFGMSGSGLSMVSSVLDCSPDVQIIHPGICDKLAEIFVPTMLEFNKCNFAEILNNYSEFFGDKDNCIHLYYSQYSQRMLNHMQYLKLTLDCRIMYLVKHPMAMNFEGDSTEFLEEWIKTAAAAKCAVGIYNIITYEDLVLDNGFKKLFDKLEIKFSDQYLRYGDFTHRFRHKYDRIDGELAGNKRKISADIFGEYLDYEIIKELRYNLWDME